MNQDSPQIAIFIDYENVRVRKGAYESPRDLLQLIYDQLPENAQRRVVRVYMSMGLPEDKGPIRMNDIYNLHSMGADPVTVPSYRSGENSQRKNIADSVMTCDIMETIFTQEYIDVFALATGDKDFIPVVRMLKKYGKQIILLVPGSPARSLMEEVSILQSPEGSLTKIVDLKSVRRGRLRNQEEEDQEENG